MTIMGLVYDQDNVSSLSPVVNCPVDDEELELLQESIRHDNYSQFARPGRGDGYFTRKQFSERVPG